MDYLADRWKCKSVWNCESHFATEIRPVCAKNGLWLCVYVCVCVRGGGGWWGVGVGKSHTWTFLGIYNSQALDKVNVTTTPHPPPTPPPPTPHKKGRYYRFLCLTIAQWYWLVYCLELSRIRIKKAKKQNTDACGKRKMASLIRQANS